MYGEKFNAFKISQICDVTVILKKTLCWKRTSKIVQTVQQIHFFEQNIFLGCELSKIYDALLETPRTRMPPTDWEFQEWISQSQFSYHPMRTEKSFSKIFDSKIWVLLNSVNFEDLRCKLKKVLVIVDQFMFVLVEVIYCLRFIISFIFVFAFYMYSIR